jgi:integral membrane sensor domain MASE1
MQELPVPEHEKKNSKRLIGKLAVVITLTVIYFFAGKLGLSLASVNPSATAVWPPAGIALAAFLILGDYVWPAILVGAFLVNITTSGFVLSSLAIAMGNTIEGLVGAYLVNRYANGVRAFTRAQDVLKFTILAGLVGTVISATIGVTSLVWGGLAPQSGFLSVWLTWLLGDATGILIVAPLLILWVTGSKHVWTPPRIAEAVFILLFSILVTMAVFGFGLLSASVNVRPPL